MNRNDINSNLLKASIHVCKDPKRTLKLLKYKQHSIFSFIPEL